MNLGQASTLLESQGRYFSDVYKLYGFKDDRPLKDYLDFVIHEPVEWLKGLPANYTSRATFGRPKTALVKLLKDERTIAVLGAEYTGRVHSVVWQTFKQHADAILSAHESKITVAQALMTAVAPTTAVAQAPAVAPENIIEETLSEDAESVHSVRGPRRPLKPEHPTNSIDWCTKYYELHKVVLQLVEAQKENPLVGAFVALLATHASVPRS
jgi:hypothetical protein